MLSRVADSLFWMSRYLERAEHTARLLDVNLALAMEQSSGAREHRWNHLLASLHMSPRPSGFATRMMWRVTDLRPARTALRC